MSMYPQDLFDMMLAGQQDQPDEQVAMPFPTPGAPSGFLDRLALALSQMPQTQHAPYYGGNTGQEFGGGLLEGLARGYSSARLGAMKQREQTQQALNQQAHDQNLMNHQATMDARKEKLAFIRNTGEHRSNRLFDLANPEPAKPTTADNAVETIVGPNGKPVYVKRADAVGKEPYFKPSESSAQADDPSIDDNTLRGMMNQYQTGNGVPTFGMGKNGVAAKRKFYSTVGQLVGMGADPGTAAGMAKSERANLTKLADQRGFLSSYGGTLSKNIQMANGLRKLAIDTNVPLMNALAMPAAKHLFGDTAITDFQAAVQPVRNEAARILQGGMTGGGQITLEGQRDLKAILGDGFTIKQFLGATSVLEREYKNRSAANDQAIKEARDRLHTLGMVTLPGDKPAGDWFEQNRPR